LKQRSLGYLDLLASCPLAIALQCERRLKVKDVLGECMAEINLDVSDTTTPVEPPPKPSQRGHYHEPAPCPPKPVATIDLVLKRRKYELFKRLTTAKEFPQMGEQARI